MSLDLYSGKKKLPKNLKEVFDKILDYKFINPKKYFFILYDLKIIFN